MQIERDFEQSWNFPHCCGALDGKHVNIIPPPNSGSYFYNYKGAHSIVMLALVNANYEFIMVHVGTNGRVSDGGVIENTEFHRKLISNQLHLPPESPLSHGVDTTPLPYVFVADDAFALTRHLMKPFSKNNLTKHERIFNYRLSRARRIVENAFGILAARFRIFHTTINLKPETVENIVLASCCLHNFLRCTARQNYTPPHSLDSENTEDGSITQGDWRNNNIQFVPLQLNHNRHYAEEAKEIREKLKRYFNNEGKVLWQDRMV
jgi:hypothetical protein